MIISFTMVLSSKVIRKLSPKDDWVVPVAWVDVQAVAPTFKKLVRLEKKLLARKVTGIYLPRILNLHVTTENKIIRVRNIEVIIPHRRPRHDTVFPCMRWVTPVTNLAFLSLPTTRSKKN